MKSETILVCLLALAGIGSFKTLGHALGTAIADEASDSPSDSVSAPDSAPPPPSLSTQAGAATFAEELARTTRASLDALHTLPADVQLELHSIAALGQEVNAASTPYYVRTPFESALVGGWSAEDFARIPHRFLVGHESSVGSAVAKLHAELGAAEATRAIADETSWQRKWLRREALRETAFVRPDSVAQDATQALRKFVPGLPESTYDDYVGWAGSAVEGTSPNREVRLAHEHATLDALNALRGRDLFGYLMARKPAWDGDLTGFAVPREEIGAWLHEWKDAGAFHPESEQVRRLMEGNLTFMADALDRALRVWREQTSAWQALDSSTLDHEDLAHALDDLEAARREVTEAHAAETMSKKQAIDVATQYQKALARAETNKIQPTVFLRDVEQTGRRGPFELAPLVSNTFDYWPYDIVPSAVEDRIFPFELPRTTKPFDNNAHGRDVYFHLGHDHSHLMSITESLFTEEGELADWFTHFMTLRRQHPPGARLDSIVGHGIFEGPLGLKNAMTRPGSIKRAPDPFVAWLQKQAWYGSSYVKKQFELGVQLAGE